MSIDYLAKLISIQGGVIVHSDSCNDEEIEEARKTGRLAVEFGHTFIYRGKIWLANAEYLIKRQIDEERFRQANATPYYPER